MNGSVRIAAAPHGSDILRGIIITTGRSGFVWDVLGGLI